VIQASPVQPKASTKKRSYQTVKPMKSVNALGRTLYKLLRDELVQRRRALQQEERRKRLAVLEKVRKEEEAIEASKRKRRIREVHQAQRETLSSKLSEPFWGDLLVRNLAQRRAAEARGLNPNSSAEQPRSSDAGADDRQHTKPFTNDNSYERIHVFGANNNSAQSSTPRPFSDEEKVFAIEFFRDEPGDDRYTRLAELLDRTPEEIFAYAKDLQECMDAAHERGQFTEDCDAWTWYVWLGTA